MGLDIGSVVDRAIDMYRQQVASQAPQPSTGTTSAPTPATSCGCSAETNPGFPAKPQTDPGAGVHGSQPWYSRADDVVFEQVASAASNAADALGYTNASRHLDHYLGNSGDDLSVDPGRIARDVPQFGQSVQQQLDTQVNAAIEQAVADGCYGQPIAIDSGWKGFYIDKGMNADWFYAMGGIQHSVTGTVVVQPGNPPTAEVNYQTHVFDRYNWDGSKATTIGPVTITDKQMGELHTAGLAQEYDIVGSSSATTYTATYNPSGGGTGNPGIPEAGDRDGERSDPRR